MVYKYKKKYREYKINQYLKTKGLEHTIDEDFQHLLLAVKNTLLCPKFKCYKVVTINTDFTATSDNTICYGLSDRNILIEYNILLKSYNTNLIYFNPIIEEIRIIENKRTDFFKNGHMNVSLGNSSTDTPGKKILSDIFNIHFKRNIKYNPTKFVMTRDTYQDHVYETYKFVEMDKEELLLMESRYDK